MLFLLGREGGAVEATAVAFAPSPGVEEEIALLHFPEGPDRTLRGLLEADFDRVVNVVAAMKSLRPFVRRIEQVAQGRDGAVVQLRCAQPDAIERGVGATEGITANRFSREGTR